MSDNEGGVPAVADEGFALIQREAMMMSKSELVPKMYQGGGEKAVANCIIAIGMANRLGADKLMVMQNLHVIQGKPGWSSAFIISAINACGRFSPLRYKMTKADKPIDVSYVETTGYGNSKKKTDKVQKDVIEETCMAYAIEKASGEVLNGPVVSISMAIKEGWMNKDGSKWKTMRELMLMYRSASFFGRLYAPDILLGMHTVEELPDMTAGATTSLEDGVVVIDEVEGEVVIEDVVEEVSEGDSCVGSADGFVTDKIDPPTGKDKDNPIDPDDVKTIFIKLYNLDIKDALAQHAEVSDILDFNAPVTSFNFLNAMQGKLVIGQLEAREEAQG